MIKSRWTIVAARATVFAVLDDGKGETLRPPFCALRSTLVSDGATASKLLAMERGQLCWAELLRSPRRSPKDASTSIPSTDARDHARA